jgi:phosphatidate cytidylyltransferase
LLKWRLLSAAVIISGLLGLLHLDFHHPIGTSGVWLLPLAMIVSVMMVYELLDLWRDREDLPSRWPVYVGAPLTVLAASVPLLWRLDGGEYPPDCPIGVLGWPLLAMTFGIALSFIGEMQRYCEPGRSTSSIALSILAIAYAGLLLSFLVNLRLLNGHEWGMVSLLSLIITVKLSDTGAYFVGRRFGKHKMAPILSPGKTIEGAIGAFGAAMLASSACYLWLVPALLGKDASRGPFWGWLLFGILIAATGMIGDLAESLLKRDAQRKDSSRWLPGLGGVLDILDSIVFTAAPAYFYFAAGIIGP